MNTLHRFPHGATRGPGLTRPLSGYGRPVGRPGPPARLVAGSAVQPSGQLDAQLAAELAAQPTTDAAAGLTASPAAPVVAPAPTRWRASRRLVHRLFMRRLVEPEPSLPEGWSLSS